MGSEKNQPETGTGIALEDEVRSDTKLPPEGAVVLHNDDYTTMEFVIEVLQKFFRKSGVEAAQIMLKVHHEGRGVAGVYSMQVAETKAAQVCQFARDRGYPLQATVEPVS